ncbi:MAG: C4-type zinc ribbon domain-containing protein [Elusimicrobiota bacterium]
MDAFKDKLNLLITLQEKDAVLDSLRLQAEAVPVKIDELNAKIEETRAAFDSLKNEITQLQVTKRQKELELEGQETEIKKHTSELNSIKKNDAYKALLSEIEESNHAKSLLENEILEIMEKIDVESKEVRERERQNRQEEAHVQVEISKLEIELNGLNGEVSKLDSERQEFAKNVPDNLQKKYDYIREGRSGLAIVYIDGENCSGCHIALRPQIINEVFKEQDFVYCDSCSRILYKK